MPPVKENDGSNKMVILARALVIFVTKAGGYLISKYGVNSPIGVLVAAIIALGELLPAAEADALLFDGDNAPVLADPDNIPGSGGILPAPPDAPA